MAAFDLDSTIITTSTGAKFPKYASDWRFLNMRVRSMIRSKHEEGYWVVVFTNQGGIANGKIDERFLRERFQGIAKSLDVPVAFYAATLNNRYRKPARGMWDRFVEDCKGVMVDKEMAFYVGDAAGRGKAPGRKKDYSDSDRKFAINAGVRFYTPEMFFDGIDESIDKIPLKGFDPRSYSNAENMVGETEESSEILDSFRKIISPPELADTLFEREESKQCMVILIGFPGSGKSTLTARYFSQKGFERINMDTLRTKARCLKATREALKDGKCVIIDNTNPRPDSRKAFIDVAKAHDKDIPIYCIVMDTPRDISEHLNSYRARLANNPALFIPAVGYHTFAKYFEEPSLEERISQIGRVKFVPHFDSQEEYKEFLQLS